MKSIIAIWLLLCVALTGMAQTTYFNKLYYTDTTSMLSVAGKVIQNNYFVVGGYNSPLSHSSLYVRKIDTQGETIFLKSICYGIHSLHIFLGNSFIEAHDNGYILVGQKGNEDTLDNFLAIKLDSQANVLWIKEYGLPNAFDSNTQIMATSDGGYLLYGWTALYNTTTGELNYSQLYLVKIDSIGNKLWEKKIGSNTEPLYAEQTQDGGFILSGYKYSSATGYDMYAVKTDSLGNLQWQQTYGTEHNDGGCVVMQLADGNFVKLGLISNEQNTKDMLSYSLLDSVGNEITNTVYERNDRFGPIGIPVLKSNGELVCTTLSYGPPPIWETAFTTLSPEGEILSETPISSGLPGEDYIRDIEPTPDGGYLLVGFNYTSPAKSWVLKVDSLGHTCGIAPCDSIAYPLSTTPARFEPSSQATLYPNPAKGSTQITYSLPPQLPFAVLELYNLQGQKVRYWVLQPSLYPSQREGITQTLDLEGLPAGIYVWRLAVPGGYERYEASGKVVVE